HRQGHIPDIERQAKTEKQNENDRQDDTHSDGRRIADHLPRLLPDERADAPQLGPQAAELAHRCAPASRARAASTTAMNASSMDACRVSPGCASCRISAGEP